MLFDSDETPQPAPLTFDTEEEAQKYIKANKNKMEESWDLHVRASGFSCKIVDYVLKVRGRFGTTPQDEAVELVDEIYGKLFPKPDGYATFDEDTQTFTECEPDFESAAKHIFHVDGVDYAYQTWYDLTFDEVVDKIEEAALPQ